MSRPDDAGHPAGVDTGDDRPAPDASAAGTTSAPPSRP